MPSSDNTDAVTGTPSRSRRRAKVSINITTSDSHEGSEAADPGNTVTTPDSSVNTSTSDLRQVRTVRTGDTTVPTGVNSRGANSSSTANLTGGLGSPQQSQQTSSPTTTVGSSECDASTVQSDSYQSMGAGTQATTTAGGLLFSALGTIREWTNDIANDLMAVDNAAGGSNNDSNTNNTNKNDEGGGSRSKNEQGGGSSAGDGGKNTTDNTNGNNSNDKKKQTSSPKRSPGRKQTSSPARLSPGRKAAAFVRSLSPTNLGRHRGNSKNTATGSNKIEQPVLVEGGTNPCGPTISQVMEEFGQAAITSSMSADDTNASNANNINNTNKPMSKMRQKLAKSARASTNNKKTMNSPARSAYSLQSDGEMLGIGMRRDRDETNSPITNDSTVMARTKRRSSDKEKHKRKTRDGRISTARSTATADTAETTNTKNKPQIIGPVQFLQNMMSTNCMATTDLAELGLVGFSSYSDSDESSSDDDESDYSDTTGHSSGRSRRQQRRSRSGGSRLRGRSTRSGRPKDIPEGEALDEASGSAFTATEIQEDLLEVIGRLPGGRVLRDKGGGTPKQHNRKGGSTSAGPESSNNAAYLRQFSKQIIDKGFPLIWHRVHNSKLEMEATDITTFIVLDEESSDPCLTWDIYDDADNGRSKKVVARGSIPLFDIASVDQAEAKHLQAYPFAMLGRSFFVTLSNGGVILFEVKDESQQQVFIRGLRWVVARLSFNLIVGNGNICTELGLIGSHDALEEDIDSTMQNVTNRLIDVSIEAVRANSMKKA